MESIATKREGNKKRVGKKQKQKRKEKKEGLRRTSTDETQTTCRQRQLEIKVIS